MVSKNLNSKCYLVYKFRSGLWVCKWQGKVYVQNQYRLVHLRLHCHPLWHGRLSCVGIPNILFSCPQRVQRNRILTHYSEHPFRNTANQFLVLIMGTWLYHEYIYILLHINSILNIILNKVKMKVHWKDKIGAVSKG